MPTTSTTRLLVVIAGIQFLLLSKTNGFLLHNSCNKHGRPIHNNKLWIISSHDTTITEESTDQSSTVKNKLTCQFCNQKFLSRNALYRHLRNDINCSKSFSPNELKPTPTTQAIALLIGYDSFSQNEQSESEIIHGMISKSFESTIKKAMDDDDSRVISVTQATAARHRHKILQQEKGCASLGDTVVVNFLSYENTNNISDIRTNLNNVLKKDWSLYASTKPDILKNYIPPQILAAKIIKPKSKSIHLHAERLCTQRIYHYLLPMDWLPDSQNIINWWSTNTDSDNFSNSWYNKPSHQIHSTPPPATLRLLKKVLSCARSPTSNSTTSSGRFGLLSNKERRCFHNFANPNLQGLASPNHEMVWLALDKVRILNLQTVNIHNDTSVVAIVEFRGDGFLPEQIRRIIGTAVAIVNGWMNESFFEYALRSDVMVNTPIAPDGRLYFSEAKYHFEEMYYKGKSFFENEEWNIQNEYADQLYKTLLHRRALPHNLQCEENWLRNLKNEVASIVENMKKEASTASNILIAPDETDEIVPHSYKKVLSLLRNLVIEQSWPTTSIARSRILKENNVNPISSSGSFTVINPKFLTDLQQSSIPIPKNNALFPELAKAVFELEEQIISSDNLQRSLSTHCAINCNAQFLPHVDSGRGKGQSLSMIVGLGSYYDGGEILVEGIGCDIRYKPLEFDGWKQRHWTSPFRGERFSLVWFTPES